jgi:hypothetical protein
MFFMRLTAIRKSLGRIAAVLAESSAAKAAALMQRPAGNGLADDPHSQARAYALDALQAVSGDLTQTPTDYAPLRQTLEGLGPAAAARFVQALNSSGPGSSRIINSKAQDRILAAMNAGPHTQTTGAVVQTIFAQSGPSAFHALPSMQQHMARALAREWYPDNPIKRIAETDRLAGILAAAQGQQLLFGRGDDDNIPLDARVDALAIIRANGSISAVTLTKTADPWTNMVIVGPLAQANAQRFLALHSGPPQTLRGTNLDNTVGYAMGFPPALPRGGLPAFAQIKAATAASDYTRGPPYEPVQAIVVRIRQLGGADPQVTVLPIEYSSSRVGPVRLPLFRVRTADGDGYVDNTGRSYSDLQDWKDHNRLPPGIVVFPDQGQLTASADGGVKLDSADTPARPDTEGKQVKGMTDDALLGGIIAGGALIIGSGAWQAHTPDSELLDRSQQGQSISPIQDSSAGGLWLSLAADTAGIAAFASEAALARTASMEAELSVATAWARGSAKVIANATNAALASAGPT